MSFQVFDNGKPADCKHHKVNKDWDQSIYGTFQQAESYASSWLGAWTPEMGILKVNVPYDYSGYGDLIEIREVFEHA